MTTLARLDAAALSTMADATAQVLRWCEQGNDAIAEAVSLEEAQGVLALVSTLEHATRVRDLNAEACVAASSLRVRAERRMGELIQTEREAGLLATRRSGRTLGVVPADTQTLAGRGITRDQAAAYARLAEPPVEKFEEAVEELATVAKTNGGTNVTRSGVLRKLNPEAEKRPDERWLEADKFVTAAKRLPSLVEPFINAVRFGFYPGDLPLIEQATERALDEAAAAIEQARTEMRRKK